MICCIDYLQLYSTTATDKLVSANVNTANAIAAWWHLANLAEADAVVVVVVVSGDKVIISVPFTVTGGHLPGTALASATSKPQHSVSSTLSLSSQSTQSLYCWCCLETYEAVNIKCITKQQPLSGLFRTARRVCLNLQRDRLTASRNFSTSRSAVAEKPPSSENICFKSVPNWTELNHQQTHQQCRVVAINKLGRLPATSVTNLPWSVAAKCIALAAGTVHSTQWSQILAQNRDFCLPHLHKTPPLGGFPSEYCYAVWYGKK